MQVGPAPRMALLPLTLCSMNQPSNGLGRWGRLSSGFRVHQPLTPGSAPTGAALKKEPALTEDPPRGSDLGIISCSDASTTVSQPSSPLPLCGFPFPSLTSFSGPSHWVFSGEISSVSSFPTLYFQI